MRHLTEHNTPKAIAGLSLAALLALTACGDGDDADTSNGEDQANGEENGEDGGGEEAGAQTFTFEEDPGPVEELTIEIPDEVMEMDEDYDPETNEILRSATVTAGDNCTIDVAYEYNQGAEEQLSLNSWNRLEGAGEMQEDGSASSGSAEELSEETKFSIAVDNPEYFDMVRDGEGNVGVFNGDSGNLFDGGDVSNVTHDIDCAAAPGDDSSTRTVYFNTIEWFEAGENTGRDLPAGDGGGEAQCQTYDVSGARVTGFAYVELSVNADGQLEVVDHDIRGYQTDASGNWIEDGDGQSNEADTGGIEGGNPCADDADGDNSGDESDETDADNGGDEEEGIEDMDDVYGTN